MCSLLLWPGGSANAQKELDWNIFYFRKAGFVKFFDNILLKEKRVTGIIFRALSK